MAEIVNPDRIDFNMDGSDAVVSATIVAVEQGTNPNVTPGTIVSTLVVPVANLTEQSPGRFRAQIHDWVLTLPLGPDDATIKYNLWVRSDSADEHTAYVEGDDTAKRVFVPNAPSDVDVQGD